MIVAAILAAPAARCKPAVCGWQNGRSVGYDIGMDPRPPRPWYRLHFATWLLLLVVAGVLAYLHTEHRLRIPGSVPGGFFGEGEGWPLSRVRLAPAVARPLVGVRAAAGSLANALAAALVLAATAAVAERIARNRDWDVLRLDRQMAFFVVAAALILAVRFHRLPHRFLMREDAEHWVLDPFAGYLHETAWAVWLIRPVLLLALGCLLYVAVRAAGRVGASAVSRLRRAPLREDSNEATAT